MLTRQKEMTAEEFLAYEEAHDIQLFNFANGKVVEIKATGTRGRIASECMFALYDYAQSNSIGKAYGRVLHVLDGKMCQPDTCIHNDLDKQDDTKDYFITAPLVAVEIQADPLTKSDQHQKALAYIKNGTKMAIAVFPGEGLEVFRPDREPLVLTYGDVLDGDDVLPGFTVKVDGLL